jgi:hypothetical protein
VVEWYNNVQDMIGSLVTSLVVQNEIVNYAVVNVIAEEVNTTITLYAVHRLFGSGACNHHVIGCRT